ncbi:MAG: NAD(P)/FAD-dependent oxidoreductase [Saprospiraceae bacterium]|nr:NAD(P)/FAD-dependent oxidoreductase [Saprospiraceae bacterium]
MNLNLPKSTDPRVVIIGAGFAGIRLAKNLKNKPFQVVLIDKTNYHTFQPLLYQVATGGLEPDSIAYPIRKVFQGGRNLHFRMAEVTGILAKEHCIETNCGMLNYDYLIIATGSQPNYFNFTSHKEQLMPLKSVANALDLRSYVLQNFENAIAIEDPVMQEALINIVIVGGGPTGIELAGALGEMKKYIFPKDYPHFHVEKMRIILFEGSDRLLSTMSPEASKKAYEYLIQFGVEINLKQLVDSYDGHCVQTKDGQRIRTETVIWTAGVMGNMPPGLSEKVILPGNRIKVDAFNLIEGYESIYAVGDVAGMNTEDHPKGHPMLATVAIQQAHSVSRNLLSLRRGKAPSPFIYRDKGSMATIGRNRAVVDLPGLKFQGVFAWFIWMFVHVVSLIGFRNRFAVLSNWIYSYFTYDRAIRLIIRPFTRKLS